MADEKINLARFDIDVDQLAKDAQTVKSRIDELRESQRALSKEGKTSSEQFIKNSASLRELQKEYGNQVKILGEVSAATGKIIPLEQQLDSVMNRQSKSINDLRKQNSDLLKIRNNVNLESAEGIKQIEDINAQMDKNNAIIKENVSQQEQQRLSVGGYVEAIREAIGTTGIFGKAQADVTNVFNSFAPVFNSIKVQYQQYTSDIRNAAAGTEGMTAAQKAATIATNLTSSSLKLLKLALIGTGIGIFVVALGTLVAYLSRSEAASNKLSKAFSAFGGIVNQILKYLEPLGEFLLDTLIKGLEGAGRAADFAMQAIAAGLKQLGFDNAARSVTNFNNAIKESIKQSQELSEAEANLEKSQRKARLTQLDYQKQAEVFRQIRDDENKTISDRIQANTQLGQVLDKQLNAELSIAKQALDVANLRLKQEGENTAALDAQADALTEIADIEERITGQRSEQLSNQVSLQKEATEAAKEAAQKRIDHMNEELDLFIAQQGIRARTMAEELELERKISNERKEILAEELRTKQISQEKYNTEIINLNNDLARRQSEIAADNARRELQNLSDRVQRERETETFLTQERFDALQKQQNELAAQSAKYEDLRKNEGLITEQEYQDALKQIVLDKDDALEEIRKERVEARKEERALEMEIELEALEAQNAATFEIEDLQIEQQRERDLEAAREKYRGTAMLANAENLINSKADRQQYELSLAKDNAILKSRSSLFGSISKIIGEETVLGKAAAIAEATMNTYAGVTMALRSLPPPASFIAAAATGAQGLAQVASIAGINIGLGQGAAQAFGDIAASAPISVQQLDMEPGFATGGVINRGIPIRRNNGDNVLITAKKGEVVLNERQQMFLGRDFLSLAGVPGFATGGVVGPSNITTVQNMIGTSIDQQLADTIGEAVREGSQLGTSAGAQQGILDLSTERAIANVASF